MRVTAARFEGAAARSGQEPAAGPPEVAIAGRSNVGKSSLINCVLNRRGLARTSRTPGRTREINFFLVNERFRIVDLPGYGFAVGPERDRLDWGPLVESYLSTRETLRGVVVLTDIRRGLQEEEIDLLGFLAERKVPAALVVTKSDKLAHGAALNAIRKLQSTAGQAVPVIPFSSHTGKGIEDFWRQIRTWLD